MSVRVLLSLFCFSFSFINAQKPIQPNATDIYRNLKALNFLGTVMYVAAHPDDENTRLISYFSNKVHAQTYYLALTRGDGGQNLLGSDLREALGLIRTQELLQARFIDGGQQRFTRAVDFGYSKSPVETLNIWNKDSVLYDMVWTIRQIKPDVIVNRFDHRTPGTTHGHHTASAMLSLEAFDHASNNNKFSSQLDDVSIWNPRRLFFNTSWWFYGGREAFEKADKSNLISFDIGEYYSELGRSNSEIASLSRSQHKSQAFGNTPRRGEQNEYLEIIKGDLPSTNDIFEGIDTSWNRVKGGAAIEKDIEDVIANFNFSKPYLSIPKLMKIYENIEKLDNEHWKSIKSKEIKSIIKSCLGLYIESVTQIPYANSLNIINIKSEVINRSPLRVKLKKIVHAEKTLLDYTSNLKNNSPIYNEFSIKIPDINSLPYWLNNPSKKGLYQVDEKKLIGLPRTPNPIQLNYLLEIEGVEINFLSDVFYKYNDPVDGEVFEHFEVLPEVSIEPSNEVVIFKNAEHQTISVQVKSYTDNFEGDLFLNLPEDWIVSPKSHKVILSKNAEVKSYEFQISPPDKTQKVDAVFYIKQRDKQYSKQINILDYDHLTKLTFSEDATSSFVNININNTMKTIGYINGAGDKIPENLESLGFTVQTIDLSTIYSSEDLSAFDAIVLGVRAYNTEEQLITKNDLLFEYVKNGGTLLTQYTTTYGLKTKKLAPIKLNLSRNRVTDENADVKFLSPNHIVLNSPNIITEKDFEGWVQERGLYFPNEWDSSFTPILEIQDYSDKPTKGSLLIAQYGKGHYIYTGLSLFRQLPAGVPGAFRLISNLLSLKSSDE